MINLKEKYAKASLRVCLNAFPVRFKNIPTERALEVLTVLGHSSERVWWVNFTDSSKRFEWTVKRFGAQGAVCKSFPLARHLTNLEFFGGPPGMLKVHKGTLLALLMDRLLRVMDNVGFKALDAIIPISESYTSSGRGW